MYPARVPLFSGQPDSHQPKGSETTEQLLHLALQSTLPKADDPVWIGKNDPVAQEPTSLHAKREEDRGRARSKVGNVEDRYRILLDASGAVADQPTVNDVLRSLRRVLTNIACVNSVGLYLFTDDGRGLKLFAYDRDAHGMAVPIGTEVPFSHAFARAVEKQERVYLPDVAQEMLKIPQLAPFASSIGKRSSYLFPVATSRKQYGVVAFTGEQGRDFADQEVELMGSLASHIAVAVENWAYEQQLGEERNRLRVTRDDLQRTEAYLTEAQRLSHTGSWALNVASGKYDYWSEESFRIHEFDPREGLPTRDEVFRQIDPEDRKRAEEIFQKSIREKVDTLDECRIVLPSGAVKHLQAILHPVLNEAGDVVQLVGTTIDVTERKRAGQEIALLSSALNKVHDAAFLSDAKAHFHYVNEEACRALGYTRAELLGMTVPDVDLQVPAERWPELWLELKAQRTLTFESCLRTRDGRIFPVEINGNYFEYGGAAYCLALVRDITERKKADEALKRSEAYLSETQKLSHTASFAFDIATNKYLYISEECFRIFELDGPDYPTREAVSRLIHPEDWQKVEVDFEKLVREKVDTSSEFRIVLPSGAIKYVQAIRHPVLNDSGKVVSIMGSILDVTERKRAEEALRESESRFRALFDHAADSFYVVDDTDQGIILDVNRQACENLGYTREELLGMSAPNCLAWDADAGMVQRIREGIAGGKVYTFEQRHRRKDGTVFPIEVRVRQYEIGGHRLHLASARDISERKRVEEERRQSAERFRAIADYTYDWENWIGVDGKLLWVNPAVERITGYSVAECMVMPDFPTPIVAEADRQTVALQMRAAVQGSSRNNFEFRVRHKDGCLVWVAASWQPIYDSQGARLGYRSSMRDIAERKRAEEALRRTTAYLAETQTLTHTGTFVADVTTKPLYWSEELFRIFGFDPKHGLPARDEPPQRIHPEDLDKFWQCWHRLIHDKVDTDVEYRVVLPDGTVKHTYGMGHPVLNANGEVVEIVGTTADITERKRAEEALLTSKAQLAHERDRLSLLLEINNHIISKLEVDELFRAVAVSTRKHLGNDATAFWLINKQSGCLERKYLDFPTGRGFLDKVVVTGPTNLQGECWCLRRPQIYLPQESADLPAALREAFTAESLISGVSIPLLGANGPLGLINMNSRRADAFSEADRDLLSQIGTQISLALDNALAYGRLQTSHDHLEDQRVYLESEISSEYSFEDIVGKSSAIKGVLQQVAVVAPTDSTVLLHGETGTGKELIARAIHNLSSRRERSFVRMNCAAIPSGLLESELFGHERGAFTGALMQRRGRFELADHGTLFLDEIGDISPDLQPKLLRAVQEQEFERLGSAKTIHVDVRIIAATHRDLTAMIRGGKFREDLFYRLNVFPIEIPPVRQRREDIPLLAHHFVAKVSRRMGKKIKSISRQTMDILINNPWPGNVRELANVLERAVILNKGEELQLDMAELRSSSTVPVAAPMMATVQEAERAMIIQALRASAGRISGKGGAAERLGLKRTTLQHKMRRLGINPILNGTDPT